MIPSSELQSARRGARSTTRDLKMMPSEPTLSSVRGLKILSPNSPGVAYSPLDRTGNALFCWDIQARDISEDAAFDVHHIEQQAWKNGDRPSRDCSYPVWDIVRLDDRHFLTSSREKHRSKYVRAAQSIAGRTTASEGSKQERLGMSEWGSKRVLDGVLVWSFQEEESSVCLEGLLRAPCVDAGTLGITLFNIDDPSNKKVKTHALCGTCGDATNLWSLNESFWNGSNGPVHRIRKQVNSYENWVWGALYSHSLRSIITLAGTGRFRVYDIEEFVCQAESRTDIGHGQMFCGCLMNSEDQDSMLVVSRANASYLYDLRCEIETPVTEFRDSSRRLPVALSPTSVNTHLFLERSRFGMVLQWDLRHSNLPVWNLPMHHKSSNLGWALGASLEEIADGVFCTSSRNWIRIWTVEGKIVDEATVLKNRTGDPRFGGFCVVGDFPFESGTEKWENEALQEKLRFLANGDYWSLRVHVANDVCEAFMSLLVWDS